MLSNVVQCCPAFLSHMWWVICFIPTTYSAFCRGIHILILNKRLLTVHTDPGVCLCRGDPHCYPFDAANHDPKDELYITSCCWYTMVRDGCHSSGDAKTLHIVANLDRVKGIATEKTYVKEIGIAVFQDHVSGSIPYGYWLPWRYRLVHVCVSMVTITMVTITHYKLVHVCVTMVTITMVTITL